MAGNGTFSKGIEIPEVERDYKTVCFLDNNIVVVQRKDGRVKLPEECHTPGRIYVLYWHDGSGVKSVAQYGNDHKKIWEIHNEDHNGICPHVHYWKGDGPVGKPQPLNKEQEALLNKVKFLIDERKKI